MTIKYKVLTEEQKIRYRVPETLRKYFQGPEEYRVWIGKKAASLRRLDSVRGTFGHPLKSVYKKMLLELFKDWNGQCFYTGLPLELYLYNTLTADQQIRQISIDHVVEDGTLLFRVCSMKYNNIKETKPSVEDFLSYCKTKISIN
jgi:hypothetical protein